jgi:micrococcal nuclease
MQAAAIAACCLLAAGAQAQVPDFAPGGPVTLAAVIDGTTISLTGGQVLRLASIDTPGGAPQTRAALSRLVTGRRLELRYAGARTDRHERVVAELFANGQWVERELVRDGAARVHGTSDNRLGLGELLADEAQARKDRRGLWRLARFAVRDASEAAHDAGTWQIVEGTVAEALRQEGGVQLIFGPDRATAFRVSLDRAALALCRTAGLDPFALAGKAIRVRGFIDGTTRPTLTVTFPEQIERL